MRRECVGSLCLGVDWVRFHTQDLCEDGDRWTLIALNLCVYMHAQHVCAHPRASLFSSEEAYKR